MQELHAFSLFFLKEIQLFINVFVSSFNKIILLFYILKYIITHFLPNNNNNCITY